MNIRGATLLPNLVVVGVAKAGTTSLFDYLTQHPEICGARRKELFYFSSLLYGEQLPPVDSYAAAFGHCSTAAVRVEATPGYYYGGRPVIDAMRALLGRHQTVLVLREPVDRLLSYYSFERSRSNIPFDMDFGAYVDRCRALRERGADGERQNNAYWGLSGGLYDAPLAEWLEAYGQDMRVVFFEQLKTDAPGVVRGLLEWLGLDATPASEFSYGVRNATVVYRNARLNEARAALRGRLKFTPHWLSSIVSRVDATLGGRRSSHGVDAELRRVLEAFYAESTANTRRMLLSAGYRNLPAWLEAHP